MRALTAAVGGRSSSANIMRLSSVWLTERAPFIVQRVGAGARSKRRCMYTLEAPLRALEKNGCPKSDRPLPAGSDNRSSISSKRSSEPRFRTRRRWARRSSCSLSRRLGSSPSSSASPTL